MGGMGVDETTCLWYMTPKLVSLNDSLGKFYECYRLFQSNPLPKSVDDDTYPVYVRHRPLNLPFHP